MNLYFKHISISVTSILLILLILYSVLRLTNIDLNEFRRGDGLKRMYQANPILVFIVIAIVIIGAYSIYKSILSQLNYMFYERYESVSLKNKHVMMGFDNFFNTFMVDINKNNINESETDTETEARYEARYETRHETEHEMKHETEHEGEYDHDNDYDHDSDKEREKDEKGKIKQKTTPKQPMRTMRSMIFRTDIDGIKYYLVMDSRNKENIPFRKNNAFQPIEEADKPILCETNGRLSKCVYPVLLREDLLDTEYRNYIDTILKAKNSNEIYPRYIHHINVNKRGNQIINQNVNQMIGMPVNPNNLPVSAPNVVTNIITFPRYQISGLIREQTSDLSTVNNEPTYQMDLLKSRSPLTTLRKIPSVVFGKNEKGGIKAIKQTIDSLNDRKFVCGSQNMASTKYSDIHFVTIPIDGSTSSISSSDTKRVSDEFIYNGKNNADITFLEPRVNMMLKLDVKDEKNVMHKDTKFLIARLDTYEDPLLTNNPGVVSSDPYYNKDSPYYKKPGIYPVGVIPLEYKECTTDKNGVIDSFCRGSKYIDGIDYSDARKIDFEVAIVGIQPIV